VTIADREFRVGDRVIARRRQRHSRRRRRDRPPHRQLTIITDTRQRRQLDASYVAEHLEHAYALT
jgi:hypothetical protein